MAAFTAIKLDVSAVEGLSQALASIDVESMGEVLSSALNEVTQETYALARKNITDGVTLQDEYIQRRMRVREATPQKLEAEIVASGAFETNISHYGAMLTPAMVNWTNDWILKEKGKFSKWSGWTERTGDEARGIRPDEKQYTMKAQVRRGRTKSIGKKFTLPGKFDTSGNPLVFRREGGTIEGVLGPSVYQLFRVAAENIQERAADNLERAIVETAEREFLKAIR